MFKIQDNEDGSTSVYCKNSGNLLCTIPAKSNSNVPRRVNVVEPQPSVGSSWRVFKKENSKHEINELVQSNDESCNDPLTSFRESKCCLSLIPISPDGDQSEDYFDDCITQDAFAKCLNLVSRQKLQTQDRKALLAEYPLRLLSRSKAYRTLQDLQDLKLPDYMPLTSYLGMKILELNKSRNFINEQKVQISVKKYDSFCRFPFNAPKPSTCHFPKLRCREKKMYPVTTTAKTLRHDANHVYTYGRRQRQERMMIMDTGLNKRSRKLLELCKKCVVKVKRLTKAEIKSWKKKKSLIYPSGAVYSPLNSAAFASTSTHTNFTAPGVSVFKSHLQPSTSLIVESQKTVGTGFLKSDSHLPFLLRTPLTSKNQLAVTPFSSRLQRKSFSTPPSICISRPLSESVLLWQEKCNRKPVIRLTNVIRYIHKCNGLYFIKGTRIRIPYYADFLRALEQRSAKSISGRRPRLSLDVRNDHAYSSLSKQYLTTEPNVLPLSKTPLQPCNAKLNSCIINAQYLSSPSTEDDGKAIPFIDLTLETSPPEESNQASIVSKKLIASQWKFHCFACGLHRFYCNTSSPSKEAAAEAAIREHMRSYHSVTDPDGFLSKYLDRVNKCTIVEAFPGYKGASD